MQLPCNFFRIFAPEPLPDSHETHPVHPACRPVPRLVRRRIVPPQGRRYGLRRAAGLPSGARSRADVARRAARLPSVALLGQLRFFGHALPRSGRHAAARRGLCPLCGADLRPPERPGADRFAHAPRLGVAPHARLLRHAGRRGAARPQLAAAQRRVLHPRAAGRARRPVVRRIRAAGPGVCPEDGDAEPRGAAGQRFHLRADHRPASTGCGRSTSCCSSPIPDAPSAARCASRSPRRRCSPK